MEIIDPHRCEIIGIAVYHPSLRPPDMACQTHRHALISKTV